MSEDKLVSPRLDVRGTTVSRPADSPAQDDPAKGQDGVSRREWLLSFGSAVVLSGFAGLPGEGAETDHVGRTSLPPGLYTPSMDHLTHALANDGASFPVPAGSETEFVTGRTGPFIPSVFSSEQFLVVRRLTEIILGPAGAPTASDEPATIYQEVAEWIDLVVSTAPAVRAAARRLTPEQRALAVAYHTSEEPVRDLETFAPDQVCREGLDWLDQEAQRKFSKSFLDSSAADQLQLVSFVSDARSDSSVVNPGTRLFEFLKSECIRGFYTSRLGLKELDYRGDAFYGHSPGCALGDSPDANPRKSG